jgi:hypothetical protein
MRGRRWESRSTMAETKLAARKGWRPPRSGIYPQTANLEEKLCAVRGDRFGLMPRTKPIVESSGWHCGRSPDEKIGRSRASSIRWRRRTWFLLR